MKADGTWMPPKADKSFSVSLRGGPAQAAGTAAGSAAGSADGAVAAIASSADGAVAFAAATAAVVAGDGATTGTTASAGARAPDDAAGPNSKGVAVLIEVICLATETVT